MTNRCLSVCLPNLPQISSRLSLKESNELVKPALKLANSFSRFTCYYKNSGLYSFFIQDCIALATESSHPKNERLGSPRDYKAAYIGVCMDGRPCNSYF